MAKTRAQKTVELEALVKAFQEGKAAAFTNYTGMSVAAITKLRKQMYASQVTYIVAKKTLLGLAAKQAGYEINFRTLPGMVGVAFGTQDEMAPAKIVGDAGKDMPIKLVGGIFEGKVVDQAFVIALAKLPSRTQLLGQLLNVMNGPMSGFARVINARREKMETAPAAN